MKRFITASDVEFLSLTGQSTLRIDEEDIVTSVAQEMAAKLGDHHHTGNFLARSGQAMDIP